MIDDFSSEYSAGNPFDSGFLGNTNFSPDDGPLCSSVDEVAEQIDEAVAAPVLSPRFRRQCVTAALKARRHDRQTLGSLLLCVLLVGVGLCGIQWLHARYAELDAQTRQRLRAATRADRQTEPESRNTEWEVVERRMRQRERNAERFRNAF